MGSWRLFVVALAIIAAMCIALYFLVCKIHDASPLKGSPTEIFRSEERI